MTRSDLVALAYALGLLLMGVVGVLLGLGLARISEDRR